MVANLMIAEHLCVGSDATFEAGRVLAGLLEPGDVVGLSGELGAGKTLLTQGIAAGLQVPPEIRITSPTFSLINEYEGGRLSIVHVDLYRIESEVELEHIGLEEMLDCAEVSIVEWCEKFPILTNDPIFVSIRIDGARLRMLSARGEGPRGTALALQWIHLLAAPHRL